MRIPEELSRIGRQTQNTLRRLTHTGVYWRWDDTSKNHVPIQFNELICPLRFDILIRFEFLGLFEKQKPLYESAPEKFIELATNHDYFKWYYYAKLPRLKYFDLNDLGSIKKSFAQRVTSFIELYKTIQSSGYRTAEPITIKTADQVLPSEAGKVVSNRYFAGNGCHRIAILMKLGHKFLSPEYYRIQRFNRMIPHDNSARLYKHVDLQESKYATFLGLRYGAGGKYSDLNELKSFVRTNHPAWIDELGSVVHGDQRGIAGPGKQ